MKLFIDSANIDEIKTAASWGIIDGVTTNPSLIAKEGRDFKKTVIEIANIVSGPVSAEVIATEAAEMIKEGIAYAKWHKQVVVKLPCTIEGLKAVRALSKRNIKTNVTLVFSVNQVLLAAKAGATFISPFVGRLDDMGEDGMQMIHDALEVIHHYGFASQLLVASVRNPLTVERAAVLGAHIATVPFKVLAQMYQHPLTDKGLAQFLADWEKTKVKSGK